MTAGTRGLPPSGWKRTLVAPAKEGKEKLAGKCRSAPEEPATPVREMHPLCEKVSVQAEERWGRSDRVAAFVVRSPRPHTSFHEE